MNFFVHHGVVYANGPQGAFCLRDNGYAEPQYWTWEVITPVQLAWVIQEYNVEMGRTG